MQRTYAVTCTTVHARDTGCAELRSVHWRYVAVVSFTVHINDVFDIFYMMLLVTVPRKH